MSSNVCQQCVTSHSQQGEDYVWLNSLGYGRVIGVKFQEPAGTGRWVDYDDRWWTEHCRAIDHSNNLYESHMNAFVRPRHPINLLFYFEDGSIVSPTSDFYRLEEQYFNSKK